MDELVVRSILRALEDPMELVTIMNRVDGKPTEHKEVSHSIDLSKSAFAEAIRSIREPSEVRLIEGHKENPLAMEPPADFVPKTAQEVLEKARKLGKNTNPVQIVGK